MASLDDLTLEQAELRKWFFDALVERRNEETKELVRQRGKLPGEFFSSDRYNYTVKHDEQGTYLQVKAYSTELAQLRAESGCDEQGGDIGVVDNIRINDAKLHTLLTAGGITDLNELKECYYVEPPGDYEILNRLGNGGTKTAYLARNKNLAEYNDSGDDKDSDDDCVLLMIRPTARGRAYYEKAYREKDNKKLDERIRKAELSSKKLRRIRHPNVLPYSLPLHGKDQDGNDTLFFEMTPYAKTLDDKLQEGHLDAEAALRYIGHIASGLLACHKEGIVHKDLNLTNVGLTEKDIAALTDFGCLSQFSSGAPQYFHPRSSMPPEMAMTTEKLMEEMKKREAEYPSDLFTPEANIWTLGVIAYRLFTNELLFNIDEPPRERNLFAPRFKKQDDELNRKIHDYPAIEESVLDRLEQVHPYARAIAGLCLQMEPEKRKGALERIVNLLDGSPELAIADGGMVKLDTKEADAIADKCFYVYGPFFHRYEDLKSRFVHWKYPPGVSPQPYMRAASSEDNRMILIDALNGLIRHIQLLGEQGKDVVYAIPVTEHPRAVVYSEVERSGIPLTYHKLNKTFYLDVFDPRFLEFQERVKQESVDSSSFYVAVIDRTFQNEVIPLWPTNVGRQRGDAFTPRLFK